MPTQIDTVVATPGDLHSGSSLGLNPPNWQLHEGGTLRLSPAQRARWRLWLESAAKIKEARQGKRLVLVFGGDLIDGTHHGTKELVSPSAEEHADMAAECVGEFLDGTGFTDGDSLFFLEGTESHTAQRENTIAKNFDDAIPFIKPNSKHKNDGKYTHPELKLSINGVEIWFAHQFLSVGTRAWTTENALMSHLRNVYFTRLENGLSIPDIISSHHYHRFTTATFERQKHTIRGIVNPPMQNRTRHARQRAAPGQFTTMGVVWHTITAGGAITRDQCLVDGKQAEEIGVIKL